jgi:hypothetical protein
VRHKKLTEGEGLRGPGLKERDGDVLTVEVEHGSTRLPLPFGFVFSTLLILSPPSFPNIFYYKLLFINYSQNSKINVKYYSFSVLLTVM